MTYLVFARTKHSEPLVSLGTVDAPDADAARETALQAFPDDEWIEMIAVPQASALTVIGSE